MDAQFVTPVCNTKNMHHLDPPSHLKWCGLSQSTSHQAMNLSPTLFSIVEGSRDHQGTRRDFLGYVTNCVAKPFKKHGSSDDD